MPIKYALFENKVAADPKDYAASVQISGDADGNDGQPVGERSDIVEVTAQG